MSNVGAIINDGGTMTFLGEVKIDIHQMNQVLGPAAANELEELVKQLGTELGKVPAERVEDARKVERRAKELIDEVEQPNPDKEAVAAKTNLFKKAAEQIQDALPLVLTIATRIATHISQAMGT